MCYAEYTNKTKIPRLEKHNEQQKRPPKQSDCSSSKQNKTGRQCEISHTTPADWNLCILCQVNKKEHLRQVQTFNMNSTINGLAALDFKLNVRIAGICDLIAAEAKYPSTCLIEQQRLAGKTTEAMISSPTTNLSFRELCHELHTAAAKGQVGIY